MPTTAHASPSSVLLVTIPFMFCRMRLSRVTLGLVFALANACLGLAVLPASADPSPTPSPRPGAQSPTKPVDVLTKSGVLWKRKSTAVHAPPAPKARAWVLIDVTDGTVLAAAHARTRQLPASTLKTLTAVSLLPQLDLNEVYTARPADVGIQGSGAGLVVGGTYTVEQLFLGMLLPSGNDAATALTHVFNPDGKRAIAFMNRTARALGTRDTVARGPNGLPIEGQYTTALDMALIARAAIANPIFVRLAQTKTIDFPGRMPKPGATRKSYQLQNENPFIKAGIPGTLAGKTGFTRAALRTYWVAVKRGQRTLLVVVLGFVGSYKDNAQKLLDWGFSQRNQIAGIATLPPLQSAPTAFPSPSANSVARGAPMALRPHLDVASHTDIPRTITKIMLVAAPLVILVRRARRIRARMRRHQVLVR